MRNFLSAVRRFVRGLSLPRPPAGRRWTLFEDGRVAFHYPRDYAMHREPDDTVAIHPRGQDSGITLRFSLHANMLNPKLPATVPEQFVVDHAESRGLQLTRSADSVFFRETYEADWPDRKVLMHYWTVATGRVLVVCSATIWGADRNSQTVQQALASVPMIIESFTTV